MFICNNFIFREDWGKVGPVENYVKNILKNLKTVKKLGGKYRLLSNLYLQCSQMYFSSQFGWTPTRERCNQVPHDRHVVKISYTKKCYFLQ